MATAADWAGETGRAWAAVAEAMDRQLAPLAVAGMARLRPQPGERVIDLGCGPGDTTLGLARAVGPDGGVTAIDISPDLAGLAARRAAGLRQVTVICADAAAHRFAPAAQDALFSRLGAMFFDDPPAAFANLRRALVPGARAVFAVFAEPAANPWATLPAAVGEALLGPPPPAPPSPGPFAWADPQVARAALEGGGFGGVAAETQDVALAIGFGEAPEPEARAAALMMRIGGLAARLRAAPERAGAVAEALAVGLRPFVEGDTVRMPARIRVISATA